MCVCKSILKPIIQLFFLLTKIQWVMFEQPRRRRWRRRFKKFSDKKERRNRNEDKKIRIENINRKDEPIVLGSYTVYDTAPYNPNGKQRVLRMAAMYDHVPCVHMLCTKHTLLLKFRLLLLKRLKIHTHPSSFATKLSTPNGFDGGFSAKKK